MGSMFRSALFKLTAVYVAIVMAISTTFSVILYNLALQELQTGFENQYIRWLTEYQPYGLRQPGDPAAELAARAEHIHSQLIYLNIIVFIVTAVASYWLARRTLRPIERTHDLQKRFTADVSHELRTPLTALKMDTEVTLLDPKASAKELRLTLESNLEETQRMELLVNNLLQLVSLEASQIRTEFERLNLGNVIRPALNVVKKYAESRNITIDMKLHDIFVVGDKPSLTQLCVILLENAIKYSPEGSTVVITLGCKSQTVRITIEDKGIGIAPDALPHVFDRFYRANNARTSSTSGSHGFGLGLSLAKLIADLHNAEIVMSSLPGKGTKAVVCLPAVTQKKQKHK